MEVHDRSDVLDVHSAIVSNSSFDDASMSNTRFHNVNLSEANILEYANLPNACFTDVNSSNVKIENAQVAEMMIDRISLGEMLQAYETAKTAGSN